MATSDRLDLGRVGIAAAQPSLLEFAKQPETSNGPMAGPPSESFQDFVLEGGDRLGKETWLAKSLLDVSLLTLCKCLKSHFENRFNCPNKAHCWMTSETRMRHGCHFES